MDFKNDLKLKILVPYYKSENELKNIQVFDKFDQKNIYCAKRGRVYYKFKS